MSWQAYVDTSLVGSGHLDKAAILSAAGDSAWAATAGFTIKPEEMKVISTIVSGDAAAKDAAFSDGIHICGERYVVTKAEGRSLYARKGKLGIAAAKTDKAIIVGHHPEQVQAGAATVVVEQLADYLIKTGY